MNNKKDDKNDLQFLPIGMCIGLSIGTAIGAALNNISLYMCIGLSIGVGIGAVIDLKKRNTKDDASE